MSIRSLKSRDMPTLSLKGGVCLPLFLFIFVILQLTVSPIFAQDLKNRTEEMYPFGTVIIAKEPLPDKVYRAQKDKILVSVIFSEKETSKPIVSSVGTGFVTETPGIILTARHLLDQALLDMEKMKEEKIKSNPQFDYSYVFMGTVITDSSWVIFPLTLEAIGEKGTIKDLMALRVNVTTMEKAKMPEDFVNPNPYSVLIKTSKFADANIKDEVYISGFAPVVAEYLDKQNKQVPVYLDIINYTFPAEVVSKITNMPINKAGIQLIYKLHDSAEPGFSGGKVVNSEGQIIGMTIAMSLAKNFIYVISSKDIKDFLKDHHLR